MDSSHRVQVHNTIKKESQVPCCFRLTEAEAQYKYFSSLRFNEVQCYEYERINVINMDYKYGQ